MMSLNFELSAYKLLDVNHVNSEVRKIRPKIGVFREEYGSAQCHTASLKS